MTDWSSALIVAAAGLASVFVVLTLLMIAMQFVGAVLAKFASGKEEQKP